MRIKFRTRWATNTFFRFNNDVAGYDGYAPDEASQSHQKSC